MKSDEALEAKTYRKVDVRLLPFLFLCYILAYLDRVNVGFCEVADAERSVFIYFIAAERLGEAFN
jgi:hypothetical protein